MNILIINIKGKNIENFIKRLIKNKIYLLKVEKLNKNEINIYIRYKEYNKILNIKATYEINVIGKKGLVNLKYIIKKNKIYLISIIFGILILFILSNIVFDINVISNETEVRNIITKELSNLGLKKYGLVKSNKEIKLIKENILNKYKDKIEWLEIEKKGVTYIVKLNLRKTNDLIKNNNITNIVSKKDAIIKKIEANSGVIIKNINDYVKKGDVIISSDISLNEDIKGKVSAKGIVYGEVWYTVTISYPFIYREENITGKYKYNYYLTFLNKDLILFRNYQNSKNSYITLYKNLFIPFKISKVKEEETKITNEINTIDLAISKAKQKAKEKIEESLTNREYVIMSKVLNTSIKDSTIECVIFYTVYEDITDYLEIEEE